MIKRSHLRCATALLLWGWLLQVQAGIPATAPQPLELLGRSAIRSAAVATIALSAEDRRWLWDRRVLRLGVGQPDYPPFDMTSSGRDYEGITADYVRLIAELLNLQVTVQRYPSRALAIEALQRGEIDLLGTTNSVEAARANLARTQAYGTDQTVLARRVDPPEALVKQRRPQRLAMVQQYLPMDVVHLLYPDAQVLEYESSLAGLGAVAFGQADLYLGNALGAHYQLSRSQLSNLQLTQVPELREHPFSFAMAHNNSRLLGLVDSALQVIDPLERRAILRRWSVEGVVIPMRAQIELTAAERRWMRRHPQVTVLIDEQLMPITYRDDQGHFRGISARVLDAISQRTGLVFNVQSASSIERMLGQVIGGEAQVLAALAASPVLEENLAFTRPYVNSAMVLVTPDHSHAPTSLEELAGQRVAVLQDSFLLEDLAQRYRGITVVQAASVNDALAKVAEGEAAAAVLSLLGARYQLAARYSGELRISGSLALRPANFAFATARGEPELLTILDKALLSIEPQELEALTHRSHPQVIVAQGYWVRNRALVLKGVVAGGVLLLLAALWISWQRRQIHRCARAERALTDQLEFMRVMIDGAPHPIYVRDRQGLLLNCNASYLKALGLSREQVIGLPITQTTVVDAEQAAAFQAAYLQAMQRGEPTVGDRQLLLVTGQALTIHHWLLPYKASNGQTVGLIAGWIDVTERERLCLAHQQAMQQAEAANEAKTRFLTTMSHEIRTPLNAVLGMLELALEKADAGGVDRVAIEVAAEAARGLLDLIGDILDISRIEGGHLQLDPQPLLLRPWLASVLKVFDTQARSKGLALELQAEVDADMPVSVDAVRLRQIVANLVGNAIKFTRVGHVRVRLEVQPRERDALVVLVVEDTGVGIAADDLAALGQPYAQAGNQASSDRPGSGLGLSISRALIELMGGEMRLSSQPGQGTQVRLTLQLARLAGDVLDQARARPAPLQPAMSPTCQALRILVVDDYPPNRVLLEHQLRHLGHDVQLAADGTAGLQAWQTEPVDVVITDCNMPAGNGYSFAREIRSIERVRQLDPCVILGCTANAQPEERQRCLEAGMDDCLFKPLSLAQLADCLSDVSACLPPVDQAPVLDLSELRRLTAGCTSSFANLLETLRTCQREDLQRLQALIVAEDLQQTPDLVHRIKGSARMIRAEAVLQACAYCEGVEEDDPDSRGEALQLLREAMESLAQALEHTEAA